MGIKDLIGRVAPVIGTALGGPLGGVATGFLLKALKIEAKPGDAGVEDKIAAATEKETPEVVAALKRAEYDFKLESDRIQVELERVHAGDRASARKREAKVGGSTINWIAGAIVAGFFFVVSIVMFGEEAAENPTRWALIGTIVGYASAKCDSVVSYYFGSSAGADKVIGKGR